MTQPKAKRAAPVRWRDGGWEYRCPSCTTKARSVRFWPLTEEFWDKRRMTICRACIGEEKRAHTRRKYRVSAAARARSSERNKAMWAAIKSDPVALNIAREKSRAASKRYRDRQKEAA